MGLKPLLSFSSGEIDPKLHDLTTLQKFKKGLATALNVIIGKTGGLLSRFSRAHFIKAKNNNETIRIYSPKNSGIITEWGNLYVRVYDFDANLLRSDTHSYVEADLPNMHFDSTIESGINFIYVFVTGKLPIRYDYLGEGLGLAAESAIMFNVPVAATNLTVVPTGAPTGYVVDYLVTRVINGQESLPVEITTGAYNKPDGAGKYNSITARIFPSPSGVDTFLGGMKVYRRPYGGSGYGFIGSSTEMVIVGGTHVECYFTDHGGDADFTNAPPSTITKLGFDSDAIRDLKSTTGLVYQQRMLLTTNTDKQAILASRPGYINNFDRDFPYDADSALKFKSGTSGKADVLRMIEKDGLIVFTTNGVYINLGILNIDNVALENKGPWVIKTSVPPLTVPGGVFFIDESTNSVRQFIYNNDIGAYDSPDHSIFSDHLFKKRTIVSWAFQGGVAPVIIAVFSDGTFATYTFNQEHQMRAWTRHKSKYPVEAVEGTSTADATFFVTNKNGQRYIEVSLPRIIPADVYVANPEADKLAANSFMDAAMTKSNLLNDSLVGTDVFALALIGGGGWGDNLTLTCGTSALFPAPGLGDVGTIFRFFDITDKTVVDLTVTARATDNEVTVKPSATFPSAQASGFRMYETFTQVTGLDHLEGESVSVLVDGWVAASPNNDFDPYPVVTVSSGTITLPDSATGAIIIVGRPITADVKTLNITTVEQSPTMLESLTVDKLYIRVHESRGLFCSNEFPEEKTGGVDGTAVKGMEDLDIFKVPDGYDIIGNRYKQPISRRVEKTIPGNWNNQGQIAIRQVDPVHFEILSIIPDVEVLKRSNK